MCASVFRPKLVLDLSRLLQHTDVLTRADGNLIRTELQYNRLGRLGTNRTEGSTRLVEIIPHACHAMRAVQRAREPGGQNFARQKNLS